MNDAIQSFMYGLIGFGFIATVVGICVGIKALIRKFLKGKQKYEEQ